jgi:hypothetical protein
MGWDVLRRGGSETLICGRTFFLPTGDVVPAAAELPTADLRVVCDIGLRAPLGLTGDGDTLLLLLMLLVVVVGALLSFIGFDDGFFFI